MLKDHYQNSPTDPPTAQSLILAEAEALLSFWPDVRNDDSLGPEEAFNLLSVWGHLRRFAPTSLDSELTDRFNRLIDDELDVVCGMAMEIEFPSDWIDTSVQLEEAWDHVTDDDSIYEIERCLREQFEILDRASLMAYSIEKLQVSTVSHKGFIALKNSIGAAENFLADHHDVFLSAAVFASAMLDSYRADLDTFDEELAETSLKHRILQGLIDEQQAPSKPVAIPREVTEELVRILASESENRNDRDGAHLVSVATTTRLDDKSSSSNLTPWDLIEQIQNELQGMPGALAAEWNDDSLHPIKNLRACRRSVEGDANVEIRFETKLSDQGTFQVIFHLVGRRADTQKYQQVILRLEGGSEKIEPIINRAAIFHLAADAWNGLPEPKLWLVDGDGLKRAVAS